MYFKYSPRNKRFHIPCYKTVDVKIDHGAFGMAAEAAMRDTGYVPTREEYFDCADFHDW